MLDIMKVFSTGFIAFAMLTLFYFHDETLQGEKDKAQSKQVKPKQVKTEWMIIHETAKGVSTIYYANETPTVTGDILSFRENGKLVWISGTYTALKNPDDKMKRLFRSKVLFGN